MKPDDSQPITLDSKSQRYAQHLLDGDRPGVIRTINYLRGHGIDKDIAAKYQLGFVNPVGAEDQQFEGRLAIPYLTRSGVVAMKYRCVMPHDCKEYARDGHPMHGKYAAPMGQEPRIFNPAAFFDAEDALGIAEGEIDAIVATERLGLPTIGIPGVENWVKYRKAWRRTLEDYAHILIFVDGDGPSDRHPDGAGLEFARAVARDVGPQARLVRCPSGEDVASMVASGQMDVLLERAGLNA